MAEFVKAKLQRITPDENEAPVGEAIDVQFNPNSLRLALTNSTDAGNSAGRQRAQYLGNGSATLTVDLVFDTADEGTTDEAKSVLDRTTPIEQLLLPQGSSQEKQSPAKVRFEWGRFVLAGVVESMNLDLELFSESGVPLRAKIGLSIREQKSEFEFMRSGAGANSPGNATSPGQAGLGAVGGVGLGLSAGIGVGIGIGAGIGIGGGISVGVGVGVGVSVGVSASFGASAGVRTTAALDGETAAELAARVGVDPAAWRAIAAGQGGSPLSLSAGAEVDFPIGIAAGPGLGAQAGVAAGASASLEASFGVAGTATRGRNGAAATLAAPGFTLAAAGGVQAALGAVDTVRSTAAASATLRAFGAPAPSPSPAALASARGVTSLPAATAAAATAGGAGGAASPRPERAEQPREPLLFTGLPSRSAQGAAAPVPAPPRPDPRAVSFGLGIPLRPRLGGAVEERSAALGGAVRPRGSGIASAAVAARSNATLPSWQRPIGSTSSALPPAAAAAAAARRSGCGCGCGGSGTSSSGGGCGCGKSNTSNASNTSNTRRGR